MEDKQIEGREKIEMKKTEKEDDLHPSFSKLRDELFKEASELCRECEVDVGVMIFPPTGKPHSFLPSKCRNSYQSISGERHASGQCRSTC